MDAIGIDPECVEFLRSVSQDNTERAMEFLQSNTLPIDIANPKTGLQALHFTAKNGNVEMGMELLKRGAEVNAQTVRGNTPLHVAALSGQTDIVKLLLRSGAKVNSESKDCGDNFTPIYMAAQIGHQEIVTLLLAHGADPTIPTLNGSLAKDVAMQQGYLAVSKLLEEYELRVRQQATGGDSPTTPTGTYDNESVGAGTDTNGDVAARTTSGGNKEGHQGGARPKGAPKFDRAIAPSPTHCPSTPKRNVESVSNGITKQ